MLRRGGLLAAVVLAMLMALLVGPGTASAEDDRFHSCTPIGSAGGIVAVACADLYVDSSIGSRRPSAQVYCQVGATTTTVECSGVRAEVVFQNVTKAKRVSAATGTCGYYAGYQPRCAAGRNPFGTAGVLSGCDRVKVVVNATVRLPGSNTVVSGKAETLPYGLC